MTITICFFLGIYLILLFLVAIGLVRVSCQNRKRNPDRPLVSVIIAARNEQASLPRLILSLQLQDYPHFEVIIVDDRSDDNTPAILAQARQNHPWLKSITVSPDDERAMAPKKNALTKGIAIAKGEILLFTDADCLPQPNWISAMVAHFTPEVGLVAGFATTRQRGLVGALSELDRLSLACVAAGTIGLNRPMTCSGGSLAYRQKVYDDVGGFSQIAAFVSGDDDLFLHLVRDQTDWQIRYCPDTLVITRPPESFGAFINQRLRHASKGKSYTLPTVVVLSAVYLLNLGLFFSPLFIWGGWITWPRVLSILLLKTVGEFIVVMWGIATWRRWQLIPVFPLMELLHIPYVTILGLWGQFARFEWKDEQFNDRVKSAKNQYGL